MPFDPHRGNNTYNNMYTQPTTPQSKSSNKSLKPIIIGVVVVLLLAVIAVGAIVVPNMAKTNDGSSQSAVKEEPNYVEIEIFDATN